MIDNTIGATMFTFNEDNFHITINNSIDYLSIAKNGDKVISSNKVIKKGRQFVLAECEIWNAKKTHMIAKGTSNLFKTSRSII
ncbi:MULTISPECIES: PaaI family thioesterase [Sphingobacterium]|uniref:PaaI family thioesterase n=1 Tax=Sphingobacterium TaxID=28453 RepID=UPI0034D973C1